jgi:chemosensory pili system protein ChpE/L-lysine exporter family protein LysE/ArgO
MLSSFATAFGLGLVFNAAPGPVFAETVRRGVRGGFRPALAVQVGSLTGDAAWALLGLAGVGLLLQLHSIRIPIGVAGALYLIWLAWESWQAGTHEFTAMTTREGESRSALRSGIFLSVTNPQNVGYWAALGSALGAVGVQEPGMVGYSVFFSGFMLSSVVWALLFAWLVDRLVGSAGASWARITYRICAIAFLALACASLRELWVSRERPLIPQSARPATWASHHIGSARAEGL